MRMLLLATAAGLLTAACATQSPYQERSNTDRYGYAEMQVQGNRVRISFNGDTMTPRETVETYLLYRAAEATLERGFDYFAFAAHDTEESVRYEATGMRPRFGVDYREISSHTAMAEIVMFEGETAPPLPNIYDAREVQQSLESHIIRSGTR